MPTDQTPVCEGAMPSGSEDQQLVPERDGADVLDSGKVRTNHDVYQSEVLVCYVDLVQAYWFPPCVILNLCAISHARWFLQPRDCAGRINC